MLRILGMILILTGSIGLGFYSSYRLSQQEKHMRELLRMVRILNGEMQSGHVSIAEAFLRTAEKMTGVCRDFLMNAAQQMNKRAGKSFHDIYEQSFRQYFYSLNIPKKEKEKLYSMGNIFVCQEWKSIFRQMEFYEKELERTITELARELPEKKKMMRSLGILGGILLIVLFW